MKTDEKEFTLEQVKPQLNEVYGEFEILLYPLDREATKNLYTPEEVAAIMVWYIGENDYEEYLDIIKNDNSITVGYTLVILLEDDLSTLKQVKLMMGLQQDGCYIDEVILDVEATDKEKARIENYVSMVYV